MKYGKFRKHVDARAVETIVLGFARVCMKTQIQDTSGSQTTSGKETLASGPSNATGEQTVVGH